MPQLTRWAQMSKSALTMFPDDRNVHDAIRAGLTGVATAQFLRQELGTLIANDQLPASIHVRIADLMSLNGNFDVARSDYEAVLRKRPSDCRVANNVAFLYTKATPPNLAKALEFADRALEIDSTKAYVWETRGQILFAAGKFKEAASNLERAANGLPESKAIHETLAKCYFKLGQTSLATAHRKTAASFPESDGVVRIYTSPDSDSESDDSDPSETENNDRTF